MEIDKKELLAAAAVAEIAPEKAEKLWKLLVEPSTEKPQLSIVHTLYYLGALIVLSAMSWFVGIGWELFGGIGMLSIALLYGFVFAFIGNLLWFKDGQKIPGGLFITLAVGMTPLAVYGFQRMTGWWGGEDPGSYSDFYSWVRGSWFSMELATLAAALIALKYYHFPFLTFIIFFILWFISMDITPLLFGQHFDWNSRAWVSLWFGLGILILAYFIDQRLNHDFAFWGYLFGLITFWSGLTVLDGAKEWEWALYCLINLFLIFLSIVLQRKAFIVFGSLGVFIYISSLFMRLFYDSALFPLILSLSGILIIYLGIVYQRYSVRIEKKVMSSIPAWLQSHLPRSRNP